MSQGAEEVFFAILKFKSRLPEAANQSVYPSSSGRKKKYNDDKLSKNHVDRLRVDSIGSILHNILYMMYTNLSFLRFRIAFTNIYNLLTMGGTCLLTLFGYLPLFTIYRNLARQKKWNNWLRNVEHIVSPYHDCQVDKKLNIISLI